MPVYVDYIRKQRGKTFQFITSLAVISLFLSLNGSVAADASKEFRVIIMQAQKGAAQNFRPLEAYLKTKGLNVSFVGAPSYTAAAKMFASGQADGMFSGSGVAGAMILKEVAYPVVRPVDKEGYSTYWAVILAQAGAPEFSGGKEYFTGKRIIYCALASSGEFFFRSVSNSPGLDTNGITAPSHGAAIAGLAKGAADIAIVKNRVWDERKDQYPELAQVGEDKGENPNGTLIAAKSASPDLVQNLTRALLSLENDNSTEAEAVRSEMGIVKYQPTSIADFAHTLMLLKKAGVDSSFDFKF